MKRYRLWVLLKLLLQLDQQKKFELFQAGVVVVRQEFGVEQVH